MTLFVSLVVVLAGAVVLGWNDAFHLSVALPLMGCALILARRLADVGDTDDSSTGELEELPILAHLLRGTLAGTLLVAIGAGGVAVTARSPLYGWFYDRDLERVIEHVQVLERAGAHDETVRLLAERASGSLSLSARARVETMRVRALMQSAEQRHGADRVTRLREALMSAQAIASSDLRDLITAKLRADETADLLSRLQLAVRESERGLVVTLPDVLFASGSDRLIESGQDQIRQIAALLNAPAHVSRAVSIEGHADATGADQVNQRLSRRRASAVAVALGAEGVDVGRLDAKGFGGARPIAANDTPDGRARNRRVEVVLLSDGPGRATRPAS